LREGVEWCVLAIEKEKLKKVLGIEIEKKGIENGGLGLDHFDFSWLLFSG
jgi:hypothetical protein